jgi:HK97 family phage portal protein
MIPISKREVGTQAAQTPGVPTTTDPNDPSNQQPKGANWEANVVRPYGRQSLLLPTWNRCVTIIMETMGQTNIQYQRKDMDGGNFVEDRGYLDRRRTIPTDGNRLNYLLQVRPNPLMTASQLVEQIEYRKIYYGNAYVYIERGEYGQVQALWLCTGGGYDPITNTYNLVYNSDRGPRMKVQASAKDVMHFKNTFLTDDMYMGIPTIDYAFKTLTIAATGDEQALQDMAKGGKHKILLREEKQPQMGTQRNSPDELRKTAKTFAGDWQSNDVVLLDNVLDPTVISQTAQQLQLLESRGYSDEAICRLMGVPMIMAIVGTSGGNYRMPEHATQEFLLRNIQPRIRKTEDEMNAKLLTAGDFGKRRIHICELPLRRLDPVGQANIDKIHLETGAMTINEIRQQYDRPAVQNGDVSMASANLMTIDALIAKGETTELKPGNYTVPAPKPAEKTNDGEGAEEGTEA